MKKLLLFALITFSLSSVYSAELAATDVNSSNESADDVRVVWTATIKGDKSSGEPLFPVASALPGPEIFGQF